MSAADLRLARARRYGRLLAGLDMAVAAIAQQSGIALDLLDAADRELLHTTLETLRGISQRAWSKA